jgi:hypothetical protein
MSNPVHLPQPRRTREREMGAQKRDRAAREHHARDKESAFLEAVGGDVPAPAEIERMRRENRIAVPPRGPEHVGSERNVELERMGKLGGLALPDVGERLVHRRAEARREHRPRQAPGHGLLEEIRIGVRRLDPALHRLPRGESERGAPFVQIPADRDEVFFRTCCGAL